MKFLPQALLAITLATSVRACTWQDGAQCGAGGTVCCKESGMVCLLDGSVSKCHIPCGAEKGSWCPDGSICAFDRTCHECAKEGDPCDNLSDCPCLGLCENKRCKGGHQGPN